MKLSISRRLGYIRVRGGRLVRVAQEHRFDPNFSAEHKQTERQLIAAPGDLAIEIVNRRTKNVLGHQYLTGAAAKSNRYGLGHLSWFEPAVLRKLKIPTPQEWEGARDAFAEHVIRLLTETRYDKTCDAAVFSIRVQKDEDPRQIAQWFMSSLSFKPVDQDSAIKDHAHVYGKISHKKRFVCIHAQPEKDVTEEPIATPFQFELMFSSPFGEVE